MAFSDFSFPQVQHDLGLTLKEANLFSQVPLVPVREEFATTLAEGATVALGIHTEKARSEFIVAPVLLELRRLLNGKVQLFSGVDFNVDPARGLVGTCDFFLAKSGLQFILRTPLVTVVEAKNDNLRNGFGQCIAEMFAAELYNQQQGASVRVIHGAVTTGSAWQFLRLEGTTLTLDVQEYYITNPGKILGVLKHIVENA